MNKELKILVDADMFMFMASAAVEREENFGGIWHLWSDISEAKQHLTDKLNYHIESALRGLMWQGDFDVVMCISDDSNFRKKVLPEYKLNRAGKRKPVCYKGLVEYVKDQFHCEQWKNLEADDVMGILATRHKDSIIISGDKDMKSIPCKLYNFMQEKLSESSLEDADFRFFYQTLCGDTTDNYKGCPSYGDKTATKLLTEKGCNWEVVLGAFKSKGLTEADALQQAHVARILRDGEYDEKTGEVKLWLPNA